VNKILTAVNKEGSFSIPLSIHVSDNIDSQVSPSKLDRNQGVLEHVNNGYEENTEQQNSASLTPNEVEETSKTMDTNDNIGEAMDSQPDSYVNKILTAVNKEGSFSIPLNGHVSDNIDSQVSPSKLDRNQRVCEHVDNSNKANTEQQNSASLTRNEVEETSITMDTHQLRSPLTISVPDDAGEPEIILPSPGSEISFPLLEKSRSMSTPVNHTVSQTPPSLPLGQYHPSPPSTLQIPDSMESLMSQFEVEDPPLRCPSLDNCNSPATSQFFTPPGSPIQEPRSEEDASLLDDHDIETTKIVGVNSTCDNAETLSGQTTSSEVAPIAENLNSFRKHLRVVCLNSLTMNRVNCTDLSSIKSGRYRIMGWISHLDGEEVDEGSLILVKGWCEECGRLDMVENFEEKGHDIFCCKRGRITMRAKKIMYLVMHITDKECTQTEYVMLVVKGEEAEMFLGCSTKQFLVDKDVRSIVEGKVKKLKGALGDFGVEKCDMTGNLRVVDTVIRD